MRSFPRQVTLTYRWRWGAAPLHIPDEQLPTSFYVRMTLTGLLGCAEVPASPHWLSPAMSSPWLADRHNAKVTLPYHSSRTYGQRQGCSLGLVL